MIWQTIARTGRAWRRSRRGASAPGASCRGWRPVRWRSAPRGGSSERLRPSRRRARPSGCGTHPWCSAAYESSNFSSNFLPIFSKLWEARSRLYRNESLQVNSHWKALDEIYKIYKLLHRSAFKNSAKFPQTFSHFYNFIFESSLIFRNFCPNLINFDEKFPEFQQICWKRSKYPRFSNFLRFRTENCWNF